MRKQIFCTKWGAAYGPEYVNIFYAKWPKQALWKRDLFGLRGAALFLDLDVVIVSNYGQPDDLIAAPDHGLFPC
jgi:hypothetical protein